MLHFILLHCCTVQQQQVKSKKILDGEKRFKYAYFCASELYLAVADGLTMKTLKVLNWNRICSNYIVKFSLSTFFVSVMIL